MVKITDNRFNHPFWVEAGENYYIVYFRSNSGNFICLRDDIVPPRVGLIFRYDELKKDIFCPAEYSETLHGTFAVDKNSWKILLQGAEDFSAFDYNTGQHKIIWHKNIPNIDFEPYVGKLFNMDISCNGTFSYLVVRQDKGIFLAELSGLHRAQESYLMFPEVLENLLKDLEDTRKYPVQWLRHNGNISIACNFVEPDIFIKLS